MAVVLDGIGSAASVAGRGAAWRSSTATWVVVIVAVVPVDGTEGLDGAGAGAREVVAWSWTAIFS